MKKSVQSGLLLASVILLFFGCSDNGTNPAPAVASATINTRLVGGTATGFSFERGAVISYPDPEGTILDFMALVHTGEGGEVGGVFFARPDSLVPSFCLLAEFTTVESASSYFQSLAELPDSLYRELALPVSAGQVWGIKTRRHTFAKIMIRHTLAYADTSHPSSPSYYGEVTFDWVYQPNGSRRF
jgi:hypothetical protein